jgi:hypothetical protein
MPKKFTAYIKYHGKEVRLYISPSGANWDNACVTVHAIDGQAIEFSLCRNKQNDWKLSPQDVPEWIHDLQPLLIAYLEKKFYD